MTPLLLAGRALSTDDVRPITSPWDGSLVAEVAHATPAEVGAALDAAAAARAPLAALSADARARALEHVRDALRARLDEVATTLCAESGKPITLARGEVSRGLDTLTDAAVAARHLTGTVEPLDAVAAGAGKLGLVRRVPAGVVTAITPFNFPINLVLHKLAPAFAAGCPVILKPAPETPLSALTLGRLFHEAFQAVGAPAGALSVLPMDTAHAGPLTADPRVAVVSFTGGPVGWDLRARTPRARVMLELGGVAVNLVCADADLGAAIPKLAVGGYANAGQSCVSVQHVMVDARVYDRFVEDFTAHVRDRVRAGDPRDPEVLCGPLIRARDADRVEAAVRGAVADGARLRCGGERHRQLLTPMVVTPGDAPLRGGLVEDEIFGPVVVVSPFERLDDAFAAVNASRFGLQAAIFTRDHATVMRAWRELEVGGVIHDEASAFRVDAMPYGGVKASGAGREGPRHAVLEYTEPRLLVVGDGR